jgi:hypothetical protein
MELGIGIILIIPIIPIWQIHSQSLDPILAKKYRLLWNKFGHNFYNEDVFYGL